MTSSDTYFAMSRMLAFEAGTAITFHAICDAVADTLENDVAVDEAELVTIEYVDSAVGVDVEERESVDIGAALELPVLVREIV